MKNFLRSKEYWSIVESRIQGPPTGAAMTDAQKVEVDAKKLKDLRAKNYLFQVIDLSILETILCKDTSKDIWDSLKKTFKGSSCHASFTI